ncbi:small ubiquitin-related modifier 2-like [Andrographis paniculata]|uniref:small ubiquitin-related modifier 2-like n=1 Tax=Andrographis paniculata TaxID=175694 RepID=UPI0021E941C4|nr:small ubiquitin-related modifier 2-like [Andrographis paniculata]XP_051148492.1 small ubiquitin-related modifier 2-like [Andrographis paniculata]XP_051148493.1 small ubiquitin-related modifier 2-like [Andrographis paniculata]
MAEAMAVADTVRARDVEIEEEEDEEEEDDDEEDEDEEEEVEIQGGEVDIEQQRTLRPAQNYVKLSVTCNDRKEDVYFSMNRKSRMKKLLMEYCRRESIEYHTTRFVIDRRQFSHNKTPNQLRLKDGHQIDALLHGNGA